MIIVCGGIKGGAGKSTIAVNLAAKRIADQKNILLVDGDEQETTKLWANAREDNYPELSKTLTCIQLSGKAARVEVLKLAPNYDDVIIDVGGRDTATQRAALTIADIVLIPLPPRSPDVWTLDKVDELISEVRTVNPDLKAYCFINRADAMGSDNKQAAALIKETEELEFISPFIGDRKAFPNAHTEGLAVSEAKPKDNKAVNELEVLYKYIFSTKQVLE